MHNHRRRLHRGSGKNAPVPVAQPGQSIILPWYYFATATISTLPTYTKMVKISAIRGVFTTKMLLRPGLCPGSHWYMYPGFTQTPSRLGRETPSHFLSLSDAVSISISILAPRLSAPRHAAPVLIIKSWRLCAQYIEIEQKLRELVSVLLLYVHVLYSLGYIIAGEVIDYMLVVVGTRHVLINMNKF